MLNIGFGENAQVTVWLSNVEHSNNISGRVIYEVATAQGTPTDQIPSYHPERP